MTSKNKTFIYIIIAVILIFCLLTINLFIHFMNKNKLYEDRRRRIDNTIINYPFFDNQKDPVIDDYLKSVDIIGIDNINYIVTYLGDYTSILFKFYQEDEIINYYSLFFNNKNELSSIKDIIKNEDILNAKIKLYIKINELNLTEEELLTATKSYFFKDKEVDIYLSYYNSSKDTTTITINYQEISEILNIPYKLDRHYKKMEVEEPKEDIKSENPKSDKKLIAFTFDDGPSKYTTELMDILDEYNAKATFFLVGYNIKIRNNIVLEEYNRGFELSNHTIDHSRLTKFTCEKMKEKLDLNNEIYHNITNDYMEFYRPPYGSYNEDVKKCIDLPIILWSVDSRDWESRNTEKIIAEVLKDLQEGDIVLFHDLYETTLNAVKILLPLLYADNYEIVTVSELFAAKNIPLVSGEVYRSANDKS